MKKNNLVKTYNIANSKKYVKIIFTNILYALKLGVNLIFIT